MAPITSIGGREPPARHAIIGAHKIEEKPAVRDGAIVIRHLVNLSISVDHRLADGWDGAMFLQDVKALLEDPTTMSMEMV